MRKIVDEEEVRASFAEFLASPKAPVACEGEGTAEEQRAREEAVSKMMGTVVPRHHHIMGAAAGRLLDARRAVVPVECTMATYGERWLQSREEEQEDVAWMGQMLLEGIVNIPFERCFVPLEVSDTVTLTDCVMQNIRIFNIHVQHCSRYVRLS